jgi:hypothetical protein
MLLHWSLFKAWTSAIVMRNAIVSQEMRSAVMDCRRGDSSPQGSGTGCLSLLVPYLAGGGLVWFRVEL